MENQRILKATQNADEQPQVDVRRALTTRYVNELPARVIHQVTRQMPRNAGGGGLRRRQREARHLSYWWRAALHVRTMHLSHAFSADKDILVPKQGIYNVKFKLPREVLGRDSLVPIIAVGRILTFFSECGC